MKRRVLFFLLLLFGTIAEPVTGQQEWIKAEPTEEQKKAGVKDLFLLRISSQQVGFVFIAPESKDSEITIGIQYMAGNISVVDSVHCWRRDGSLTQVDELFSANADKGKGEKVEVRYIPILAMFVSSTLNQKLPPLVLQCYDLYEQKAYKKIIEFGKLWKLAKTTPEEGKYYAYKYISDGLVILVSQDQERIRMTATSASTTHLIEVEGRYVPKIVREEWNTQQKPNSAEELDLRRNRSLANSFFFLASVQRAVRAIQTR